MKKIFVAFSCAVLLSGCGETKQITTVELGPPPPPDTVEIEIPENFIVVEPIPYRETFTVTNQLVHTKLEVKFDWNKKYLYGKAWVTLKPHFYPIDSVLLDAKGYNVHKVELVKSSGNLPVKYSYDSLKLHIQLDKVYKRNEQYTLFIDYTAKPYEREAGGSAAIHEERGLYFINADGKDPNIPRQLWTQGETQASSGWFPTIDQPNMKTTLELSMTVEDGYVSLSNGLMTSSRKNTDGTHTDTWKLDQPVGPYLIMMAAGPYAVVKDKWKNIEVSYYVDKEYESDARAIFGHTPEMIEFFSGITGIPYVWPKYSQAIAHEFVTGAMENATAVIHGSFVQMHKREMIDGSYEDVVSHELFHHWFGDLVTTESWSNITLNESFATYGEYLWNEHKYGRDEADYRLYNELRGYLAGPDNATVNLVRFDYSSPDEMFDAVSYNKGGLVLHMLRNHVGDEAFFQSLNEYLNAHKFGTAEAHDLRLAFEKVTGRDLNWFFNQWYYDSGHPKLNVYSVYNPESKSVDVTVEQEQDTEAGTPVFRIPAAIDIYANGKVNRHQATFKEEDQTLSFLCESKPDLVNFDGDKMLLCTKTVQQSDTAFAFQYHHAQRFMDRFEAIQYFKKNTSSPLYDEIISTALADTFWHIRLQAVRGVTTSENEALKKKVKQLVREDPKSNVRAACLDEIKNWEEDQEIMGLLENALSDSSYLVISSSLDAIYYLDSVKAFQLAQRFENENSDDIRDAIIAIYAFQAGPEKNNFMLQSLSKAGGFSKYGILQYYGIYLANNVSNTEVLKPAIPVIYDLGKNDSRWYVRYQAVNSLQRVLKSLQEQKEDILNRLDQSSQQQQDQLNMISRQIEELTKNIKELEENETDPRLKTLYDQE